MVIRSSALGRDGAVAPSERIVMAGIGINLRGRQVLGKFLGEKSAQVMAICDVRRASRDAASDMVNRAYGNSDCRVYSDLREVLGRSDIDAVLIAAGDRWHAAASVMAMRAGKDVYCETPSSMSIAQSRVVKETAASYMRIYQSGNQRRSQGAFVYAAKLARSGRLGSLKSMCAQVLETVAAPRWLAEEPLPAREELDWDLWLGPAPRRPYNAKYIDGGWRGQPDLYAGGICEMGSHTVALCHWAAQAEPSAAVEYLIPESGAAEMLMARLSNGVRLELVSGGWRGAGGVTFKGSEGWISCADGYSRPEVSSSVLLSDYEKVLRDYPEQDRRPLDHVGDFLNCVRTRRSAASSATVTHAAMTTCHAATICLRLKRNLRWEAASDSFTKDEQANRLRSRSERAPWGV